MQETTTPSHGPASARLRGCLLRHHDGASLPWPVHHHGRNVFKEGAQRQINVSRELRLVERARHQLDPSIARPAVDGERGVPHAQTRVSALLDIARRTTKSPNQEVAEALFCADEIVRWIHGPKNVVTRHLSIERGNQPFESQVGLGSQLGRPVPQVWHTLGSDPSVRNGYR